MLTLKTDLYVFEFAKSKDPDKVAHNEPPHLSLHCLPSGPGCSKLTTSLVNVSFLKISNVKI